MRLDQLPLAMRMQAIRKMQETYGGKGAKTPSNSSDCIEPTTTRGKQADAGKRGKTRLQCNASLVKMTIGEVGGGFPPMTCMYIKIAVNPRELPTAQQKGVDFKHKLFFTKPKVKAWERKLSDIFSQCVRSSVDGKSVDVPRFCQHGVAVSITFHFPYPDSTPKKMCVEGAYMTKRPDCDNLAKGVLDSMTQGGIITDDNCIHSLCLSKRYTLKEPSMEIRIIANNYHCQQ